MTRLLHRRLGARAGSGPRRPNPTGILALCAGCAVVGYTYAGYPLLLTAAGRLGRRRRSLHGDDPPAELSQHTISQDSISVVIAALNEETVIGAKIEDLRRQQYPQGSVEVIVVADGSTDSTAAVAEAHGVRVLWQPAARGKSDAVNRGVAAAHGEVVVLTDANCALSSNALHDLAASFTDPTVAVASGAKQVVGSGAHGGGEGLYWRLESFLKSGESRYGAVMGAPGEICALRRSAFRPIPRGVLNDDYHITCDALVRGYRSTYVRDAEAIERVSSSSRDEMERRSRIAAGTWQTTLMHLRLADPRRGWVCVAFVSHRLLRSIVTPVLLPMIFMGSAAAATRSRLARVLFVLQAVFYGLGLLGFMTKRRFAAVPFQFLLTNVASLRGGFRLLTRRQPTVWRRVERGDWIAAE